MPVLALLGGLYCLAVGIIKKEKPISPKWARPFRTGK